MADEFTIERQTRGWLEVRHIREGHLYRFPIIAGQHVRRKLADGPRTDNLKAKRQSAFYALQARVFAERKARRADLID